MCVRSNGSPQPTTFLLPVVPFCSLEDDGHSLRMKADGNGGHVEWNDSMAALKHCGEEQACQTLAARNLRVAFWMQMIVHVAETEVNLSSSSRYQAGCYQAGGFCGCFCRHHSSLQHRSASTYRQLIALTGFRAFFMPFPLKAWWASETSFFSGDPFSKFYKWKTEKMKSIHVLPGESCSKHRMW